MDSSDISQLDTRRRIYQRILMIPGLHERELSRILGLPLSTVDYHVHCLVKRNLVVVKEDGRYRRLFSVGEIGVVDKKVLSILRQRVPREMILFLLLHPRVSHKSICEQIRLAPSTISFHLKKLLDLELVLSEQCGRETVFWMKDPELVCDLLISYQKSFLDASVNHFVETWLEIHPRYLQRSKKKKNEGEGGLLELIIFAASEYGNRGECNYQYPCSPC